jgi:hypothetical protein
MRWFPASLPTDLQPQRRGGATPGNVAAVVLPWGIAFGVPPV